jgi:hypothetical protein
MFTIDSLCFKQKCGALLYFDEEIECRLGKLEIQPPCSLREITSGQ